MNILNMDKRLKALVILGLLISMSLVVSAQADAPEMICTILCSITRLVMFIVVFVVVAMIIIYGAKWAMSGEDPGARTAAKNGIIHVIIAFVAIFLALYIISWLADIAGFDIGAIMNPTDLLTTNCDGLCTGIDL